MKDFLDVAINAAVEAGAILKEKLGKVGQYEKGPADLVTEADVMAQRKIEKIVLSEFPDHCFLGEESQGNTPTFGDAFESKVPEAQMLKESQCGSFAPESQPYTWIVDPLDGTTNFVHGVRFFCVSIALARGADILCGAIFNPNDGELFTARKGEGAFLNGSRIKTSTATRAKDALMSVSFATRTREDSPDYLVFKRCVTVCQSMRRTGSTALNLAYVACGRFDAMSCQCAHPWDVAAGVRILFEAGGVATHVDGSPFDLAFKPLLATANQELHDEFLRLVNG